eukprot:5225600-Alexandrium_andersonii.AAC.1
MSVSTQSNLHAPWAHCLAPIVMESASTLHAARSSTLRDSPCHAREHLQLKQCAYATTCCDGSTMPIYLYDHPSGDKEVGGILNPLMTTANT